MALFKRKDKDTKKGAETTIGKIIYGFLLFMPLLSIGARCLYVIFNKNAYQSYSDSYVQATQKVTNSSQFISGNEYIANYNGLETNPIYGAWVTYNSISIDWSDYGFDDNTYNQFRLFSNSIVQLRDTNNTQYQKTGVWGQTLTHFTFNLNTIGTESVLNGGVDYIALFYSTNKLDNVFEYSINQTQQSNIYNWAKETGTYTVLHNTTTGIGITNEFIPMLMAYWLIISVIYFLFDIALILIWAVHKKIHELMEAI